MAAAVITLASGFAFLEAPLALLRAKEGGEVAGEVRPGSPVFACALGGADGRTLFACAAPDFDQAARTAARAARLLATRVDVPAA